MKQKKVLVILGNGFDLDLGWKTSFKDFYEAKRGDFELYNGNPYIETMIEGKYWYNLEGYLRNCIINIDDSRLEPLNSFWQICGNFMLDYLKKNLSQFVTNKNCCAYNFLQCINDNTTVYTFNYTNPFEELGFKQPAMHFIHGKLAGAYTGSQLKLGVDTNVKNLNTLANNKEIKPIIKVDANTEKDSLIKELKDSDIIIFFGQSLYITDSDYFKRFFEKMSDNKICSKSLYIVTYDANGLQSIKNNLEEYNISFDDLEFSNNTINVVFTSQGVSSEAYKQMVNEFLGV